MGDKQQEGRGANRESRFVNEDERLKVLSFRDPNNANEVRRILCVPHQPIALSVKEVAAIKSRDLSAMMLSSLKALKADEQYDVVVPPPQKREEAEA